jgi:hypothetical protein
MAHITTLREEFSKVMSLKEAAPAEDQNSHDSASTDEEGAGAAQKGISIITNFNFYRLMPSYVVTS